MRAELSTSRATPHMITDDQSGSGRVFGRSLHWRGAVRPAIQGEQLAADDARGARDGERLGGSGVHADATFRVSAGERLGERDGQLALRAIAGDVVGEHRGEEAGVGSLAHHLESGRDEIATHVGE